ncbi:MAG: alpha-glucan family phosphorylase, partial [Bacteroidales bacterium]|nr:alpha-glucan family phosphorylase [Bacteroidales bacterium]
VYHCNEGHAALINAQRLVDYVVSGLTFDEALEVVRASSLYTVHTPVPAGHDYFDEGMFSKYMSLFPQKLGISWQQFMDMGREHPGTNERFCMSTFACNTSQEVNGVSWLHGKVSREMFSGIWQGYFPEELHVGYVTNGVHMPTWTASEWKAVYGKYFDKNWINDQSNAKIWEAIENVPDEEIWETRMKLKNRLFKFIKTQFEDSWLKTQGDPSRVVSILEKMNPAALTIGFARRFATYKRAHLLFTDLERLSKIVNNPERPVQFLFAGKAHPADGAGQGLIKHIIEISKMPEFLGKIIFLENYDMTLARRLVTGVDIWLNTPTRPLEASGTSGEKAEMNGVLNFSVLDGWWLEGYRKGAGWALTDKRTYVNQAHQDQLDAASIYSMFEMKIIPLYFARNAKGYSPDWIQTIRNSICQIAPHYTMKRQLDDYYDKFYYKLADRSAKITANNFEKAKEIAAWKNKVAEGWDNIEVLSAIPPTRPTSFVGEEIHKTIVIDTKGLGNSVGVELVVTALDADNKDCLVEVKELDLVNEDGSILTFELKYMNFRAGTIKTQYRIFPKSADLPHRQDFCYVTWF